MLRRARLLSVCSMLLAGGMGVISSTQTWADVHRDDGGQALSVTGADLFPLLTPLSLAVLALGAALSISGPIERFGRSPGLRYGPVLAAAAARLHA